MRDVAAMGEIISNNLRQCLFCDIGSSIVKEKRALVHNVIMVKNATCEMEHYLSEQ